MFLELSKLHMILTDLFFNWEDYFYNLEIKNSIYLQWHMTRDKWHVTSAMWHVTSDSWHMEGGEHSLKIAAP